MKWGCNMDRTEIFYEWIVEKGYADNVDEICQNLFSSWEWDELSYQFDEETGGCYD